MPDIGNEESSLETIQIFTFSFLGCMQHYVVATNIYLIFFPGSSFELTSNYGLRPFLGAGIHASRSNFNTPSTHQQFQYN